VDEALEKDQGDGPDDRSDLAALTAAAREPDLAQRWQRLSKLLDIDQFITFMAMEVIVCHRDGYCLGRNNFRIYHDPATDRWVFFPHGMDQLFGRPDATIRPVMQGLVARAVMETPEGRRQYRERLAVLTTNVLDVSSVQRQADAFLTRVRPALEPEEARVLAEALAEVKQRVAERRQRLEQQLREPEPSLLGFENGVARLSGWKPVDAPAGGRLDESTAPDGRKSLHLRAGPVTSASWRTTVLLAKGRYRFQAAVRTQGVEALNFGRNHGAGLRVVGGSPTLRYELTGDHEWTRLEQPFEIQSDQEVELICELRARAGEAWFELESLRLVNGPEPR
jgi:CotH kinase protein